MVLLCVQCSSDFIYNSEEFCLRLHVCMCVYPFVRFGEEEDNGAGPGRDSNPLPSWRVSTFIVIFYTASDEQDFGVSTESLLTCR